MFRRRFRLTNSQRRRRAGAATLDYILLLAVVLPLATIVIPLTIRSLRLVYEMTCVLIAWPFL
jgi:hypothetical protein